MTPTSPGTPFLAKVLLVGSGIMSFANATTIPFLAVFLRTELDMGVTSVGLLLGSSIVFAVLGGFLGGTLSDVLGRVKVLLLCLAGVVVSFTGLYFSHSVVAAFAFNTTMVLCTSAFNPVAKALLGDLLPADRRVTWFSYQYVAYNVGFVIGPPAGVALGFSGARISFAAAGALYAVYFVLLLIVRPRSGPLRARDRAAPSRPDEPGAFARLAQSLRLVLSDRRLLWIVLAALLLETVHNRISVLLAQFFTGGPVDQRAVLAAVMTTNALTVVLFQLLAARFVRRREPVTSMTVGGLLTFAGMAGFAVAQAPWQFVAAMVVFSLGETVIAPAEFALIDRIAPEDQRGSYFGAQTFAQFGGFLGPYFGSLLLAGFGGSAMFLGIGSLALVAMAIYLVVGRWLPRASPEVAGKGGIDVPN